MTRYSTWDKRMAAVFGYEMQRQLQPVFLLAMIPGKVTFQ